ncbi:hypothetical protein N3K66_008513 [Trichothecium roseum]|uniref:Uncharacterized protein n=1 Tax=Trichothecium roseum TaxID=47278 RepID=A0ACC0URQ9_9HYPO|nr:hypothetical protein N3K66_008513 [Trichothecium roseum]
MSSLLLLPSPPSPPTRATLRAAYHATLEPVLQRLSESPDSKLIVALVAPMAEAQWQPFQSLLAGVYSLIASLQAKHDTSADVTVIPVQHKYGDKYAVDRISPPKLSTIRDLGAFSESKHQGRWKYIFHPSCELGYGVLNTFLETAERTHHFLQSNIIALPGGISLKEVVQTPRSDTGPASALQKYHTVCLGGTFDHLHVGHKLLLQGALLMLKVSPQRDNPDPTVLIAGVTGDALLTKKQFAAELEPWNVRARAVLSVIATALAEPLPDTVISDTAEDRKIGDNEEVQAKFDNGSILVRCVNIPDPFGPTISEEGCDAIVVSGETRSGGKAINDKRAGKGWRPLDVYEIDVLDATVAEDDDADGSDGSLTRQLEDFSAKISSTEIRRKAAEARSQSVTNHATSHATNHAS